MGDAPSKLAAGPKMAAASFAAGIGLLLCGPAAAQTPFAVAGLHLGDNFNASPIGSQLQCSPSELFPSMTWCMGQNRTVARSGAAMPTVAALHDSAGRVWYAWQMISPASFGPGDIDREIDRLSRSFGQSPTVLRTPPRAGRLAGVIVSWGAIRLEPLDAAAMQTLASGGSPHKGFMVDYLGDFRKSALESLPVFLIAGGAGMVYSAAFDEAGRGNLRLAIANASQLSLYGAPPVAAAPAFSAAPPAISYPTPPPAAVAPVVAAPQPQTWGAVSIANDGAGGSAWNYASQQQAVDSVIQQCRSSSQYPDTCSVSYVSGSNWAAAVRCSNDSMMRATSAWGYSAKQAISNAFRADLQDGSYTKDQCKLVNLIAGDGSQARFLGDQ